MGSRRVKPEEPDIEQREKKSRRTIESLAPSDRKLLSELLDLEKASTYALAKNTGMSYASMYTSTKKLESLGLIAKLREVHSEKGGRKILYVLTEEGLRVTSKRLPGDHGVDLNGLIEQKRRTCNRRLREYLRNGVLSRESYDGLRSLNSSIAKELHAAISIGGDLIEDHIIESTDDLIQLVRVRSPTEARIEMFRMIGGPLGRQNAGIRATAAYFCSAILQSSRTSFSRNFINSHYELQGKPLDDLTEDQMLEMRICSEIAESIYEYLCYRMDHTSERAEYLQPPLFTLEVTKGGDCDDLTTLLCSLWESIGYETTLHFIPSHCFPGVKLAVPVKAEGIVKIYNVRADPTIKRLNMFKFSYDLCVGKKDLKDLPEGLRTSYEAKSFTVPPIEYPKYREVG